jgi:hypothetical protein
MTLLMMVVAECSESHAELGDDEDEGFDCCTGELGGGESDVELGMPRISHCEKSHLQACARTHTHSEQAN